VGLFTALSDVEVAQIADGYGLPAPTRVTPIAAGTVNSNFALELGEARWFLRVNEGKREAEVAIEAAVLDAACARGVTTPRPRRARDGCPYLAHGGRWLSLFPWLEGVHRDRDVRADDLRALGRALATLHAVPLGDVPALGPSRYGDDELARRRARIAAAGQGELAAPLAVLEREAAWLTTQAAVRAAARQAVIHGDLFRDNVLWRASDDATLVALLDFEQASRGSIAYDLAVCINDWCWDEASHRADADLAQALLAGYQSVSPLAPADRLALGVELRAAAARFATTRITDVYLRGIVSPAKDFRAYLDRLGGWQGGQLGPLVVAV
jgi:homoserine kinase type II